MLSFSGEQDAGTEVLEHVYEAMRIDEQWSVRLPRGFTWWGKDFGQSVWSTQAVPDGDYDLSTVYAVTDVLHGFVANERNLELLNRANAFRATLSGLLVPRAHPDRVCFMAKMVVHDDIVNWAGSLFSLAVAMQAADAQAKAQELADQLGGRPALSSHPFAGARPVADDMLNIHRMVVTEGKAPSAWMGPELTSIANLFSSAPGIRAVGHETGVMIHLPFANPAEAAPASPDAPPLTSLLEMSTDDRHPQVGNGMAVRLTLPLTMSEAEALQAAVRLNQLDAAEATTHLLGAWCRSPANALTFVSFYPNAIHEPGAAMNIAFSMASRARWAAERVAAKQDLS